MILADTRHTALCEVREVVRRLRDDPNTFFSDEHHRAMRAATPQGALRSCAAVAAMIGSHEAIVRFNGLAASCELHALTWAEIDEAAS